MRYDQNELDSPEVQAGDVGFFALDSRTQPEDLAPGVVQASENMRLERRIAVTRKGLDKVTNDIDPGGTVPLIVPFTVGSAAVVRDTWADGLFCSCVFSDPNDANREWLFLASGSSAWAWNEDEGVEELGYPAGQTITSADKVDMFQAEGSVYILRGERAADTSISYISRATSVATAIISGGHNLVTGDWIEISGAYPDWYNKSTSFQPTVSNATTLTYTTGAFTDLADSLLETAVTNTHFVSQPYTANAVPTTYSIYAKPVSRSWVALQYNDSAAEEHFASFDISTGVVGTVSEFVTSTAVSNAGDGWFRISMTFTPSSGAGSASIVGEDDDDSTNYAGDITKGYYLFGAQMELGSSATNYEPTTSAGGSRNLLTYSEDFSDAAWTKTRITASPNAAAEPATGTIVFNQRKAPLRWDGDFEDPFVAVSQGTISAPFIYMPPSDFALMIQNRAILQYTRNQAIVSDILDVESYDSIFGVFTINSGQADYLVGFHPYQDNKALLFGRRSLFLLNDIDIDPNAMTKQEITRQVGCVARGSIATCGPDVLFLSDLGVFRLQPGLELQLRGNSEPLSAPINDVIETINTSVINRATAAYWNNRYYLAVPVDGATRNNRILVYNFINNNGLGAWESVDTLPNGMYADFLDVMQFGDKDTLFVSSQEGGVYAYEQLEFDEYGAAGHAPATFAIPGRLRTRRLLFDSYNLKHFNRTTVNLSLNANSTIVITANTVNPDGTKTLKTFSTTSAEDVTYPLLINKRGYGLDLEFENTAGRSTIVNFSATAYEQNRKNIKIT